MRLKLYHASSVAEAMAQVRAEIGPDALIVSNRRTAAGIELTVATEPADEPPAILPETRAAELAYHAVPPALSARLCRPGPAGLADALAAEFRFSRLPGIAAEPDGRHRPLMLAGMPGAGKTLSVARLATRLVLDGIRPVVITADGRRAGAAEELAAYTRLLGLDLIVASTPATIARALGSARVPNGAPVLIDSAGIDPFDPAQVNALRELARAAHATPVLVMPAGLHPDEAAEQARAYAPLDVGHLLATRLDLARRLGSILAAAHAGDLALTAAGIGPGATDTLVPLTPAFLADRLQRGGSVAAYAPPHAHPAHAQPAPAQPAHAQARPIFPTARARAAEVWSSERHG